MKTHYKLSKNCSTHGQNCEISGPYNISTSVKSNIPDVWNWNFWSLFGLEIEVGWGGMASQALQRLRLYFNMIRVHPLLYHRLLSLLRFTIVSAFFYNFLQYFSFLFQIFINVIAGGRLFYKYAKKAEVSAQRRIMICLNERQYKLKRSKITYKGKTWGKVTLARCDQLFYLSNTFILHYLAIISRNSHRDVVIPHFWTKFLKNTCYRMLPMQNIKQLFAEHLFSAEFLF